MGNIEPQHKIQLYKTHNTEKNTKRGGSKKSLVVKTTINEIIKYCAEHNKNKKKKYWLHWEVIE